MNILGLQTWPTCGLVTAANDRTIDLINRIREDKVDTTRQTLLVVGELLQFFRRMCGASLRDGHESVCGGTNL